MKSNIDFSVVKEFGNKVSNFFGATYGIPVDSCTHGLELCLRLFNVTEINVPKRTYISVPFLANKLGINLKWRDEDWVDKYIISNDPYPIIDAAVMWKKDSYISGSFMCLSFQYQKHLSLGRGGMILCDNLDYADQLTKMSYDGRLPLIPWREQNINSFGYHYYMTPETAQLGLNKLEQAINTPPRKWVVTDWPDLTQNDIFNN